MSDQGHNSNVELDIDELLSFLNELDDKKLTVNEANGTLRSRIKEILGERDWNKARLPTFARSTPCPRPPEPITCGPSRFCSTA